MTNIYAYYLLIAEYKYKFYLSKNKLKLTEQLISSYDIENLKITDKNQIKKTN